MNIRYSGNEDDFGCEYAIQQVVVAERLAGNVQLSTPTVGGKQERHRRSMAVTV
jgi:hypothetical protein